MSGLLAGAGMILMVVLRGLLRLLRALVRGLTDASRGLASRGYPGAAAAALVLPVMLLAGVFLWRSLTLAVAVAAAAATALLIDFLPGLSDGRGLRAGGIPARILQVERQEPSAGGGPVRTTIAAETASGIHVVEMRGRRMSGLLAPGHRVILPPGDPGRVRRVRRLWNETLGVTVVCR